MVPDFQTLGSFREQMERVSDPWRHGILQCLGPRLLPPRGYKTSRSFIKIGFPMVSTYLANCIAAIAVSLYFLMKICLGLLFPPPGLNCIAAIRQVPARKLLVQRIGSPVQLVVCAGSFLDERHRCCSMRRRRTLNEEEQVSKSQPRIYGDGQGFNSLYILSFGLHSLADA